MWRGGPPRSRLRGRQRTDATLVSVERSRECTAARRRGRSVASERALSHLADGAHAIRPTGRPVERTSGGGRSGAAHTVT